MSPAMELLKRIVSSDASQIDAVVARLAEAWNRHDSEAYGAEFTSDSDFVNVLGAHFHGRQQIAEQHAFLFQSIMRDSRLHILQHSIRFVTDAVAVVHIKWEMEGHQPPPGWNVAEVRQGVLSLTVVREATDWKIAAAHNTDIVIL